MSPFVTVSENERALSLVTSALFSARLCPSIFTSTLLTRSLSGSTEIQMEIPLLTTNVSVLFHLFSAVFKYFGSGVVVSALLVLLNSPSMHSCCSSCTISLCVTSNIFVNALRARSFMSSVKTIRFHKWANVSFQVVRN